MVRGGLSKKSTTCKVCNRAVRFDNETFPYCHYHVNLKYAESQFDPQGDPEALELIRRDLYRPPLVGVSSFRQNVEIISEKTLLHPRFIGGVQKVWYRAVKGKNIYSPKDMLDVRETVLQELESHVSQRYEMVRVDCVGGSIFVPGSGVKKTLDHEALLIQDNDRKYIIDGCPAAPLAGVVDDVSKAFSSGKTTLGDGLVLTTLFEYGAFSGVKYNSLMRRDTNEVIWHNKSASSNDDIESQRKLIEKFGYDNSLAPSVSYLSSATDWAKQEERVVEKETQDTQSQEPQSVDDILDFIF